MVVVEGGKVEDRISVLCRRLLMSLHRPYVSC